MQTVTNIQTYPRRPSKVAEYKYSMSAVQLSDWKRSMEHSLRTLPAWKKHDSVIEEIAATYNRHFLLNNSCDAGFFVAPRVDPKLIKAIIYTETGPGAPRAWDTRPMQIGNTGDAGINDVLSTDKFTGENMKLILPEAYRYINHENIRSMPKENIIAGTAYLLLRASTFATVTLQEDGQMLEFVVTKETRILNEFPRLREQQLKFYARSIQTRTPATYSWGKN